VIGSSNYKKRVEKGEKGVINIEITTS